MLCEMLSLMGHIIMGGTNGGGRLCNLLRVSFHVDRLPTRF